MPVKTPVPYNPYIKLEQTIRIDLKTPTESSFTPIGLPTSEPATGQFVRTLVAGDFPDITPVDVYKLDIFHLVQVGQNTTGAAITLNWRMMKNGVEVAIGTSSITASNFWRLMATWQGVTVGDVIEIKLWGSAAGLNYDFFGWQIHPSRVCSIEALNSPCYASFDGFVSAPAFVGANAPTGAITNTGFSVRHLDIFLSVITAATSFDILLPKIGFRLMQVAYGDATVPINIVAVVVGTTRAGLTRLRSWIPTIIALKIWKLW